MPTAISLCSGIGGLDLAFEMAGIHVTHMIEWNAFCCDVLRARFPDSTVIHGSIEDERNLPYADVVFGGTPCQPYSSAGKQDGFADERNLWPAAFRIIQQVRPRAVLIENVRGSVTGSDNLADYVLGDLENIGYAGRPFLVPACLFGAPHERYRVFIVAYATSNRPCKPTNGTINNRERQSEIYQQPRCRVSNLSFAGRQVMEYTQRPRLQKPVETGQRTHPAQASRGLDNRLKRPSANAQRSRLSQSSIFGTHDGLPGGLDFPGFPAGQGTFQYPYEPPRTVETKSAWHKERVQALGNAVIWQQAYPLAQAIHDWLVSHAV